MIKISVLIAKKHSTSISLENEFYTELVKIACKMSMTRNQLITYIDSQRTTENLSSAIRLFILDYYKKQLNPPK